MKERLEGKDRAEGGRKGRRVFELLGVWWSLAWLWPISQSHEPLGDQK